MLVRRLLKWGAKFVKFYNGGAGGRGGGGQGRWKQLNPDFKVNVTGLNHVSCRILHIFLIMCLR